MPLTTAELKHQLSILSDADRYRLLATLRTGEINKEDVELRWFFLRLIVARAYMRSYKTSYSVKREWFETEHYFDKSSYLSYDMEVNRILALIEHIRKYKFNKIPQEGYTEDMAAVAMALKAYYFRFTQYDMTLYMEAKGISFWRYTLLGEYGQLRHNRYERYAALTDIETLLRRAGWDAENALRLWVQDREDAAEDIVPEMSSMHYRITRKRPTPAMALGMYARILRHMQVNNVTEALSLDELLSNEWGVVYEHNVKSAMRCCHDAAERYYQLKKEAQKVGSKFRNTDNRFF